MNQLIPSAEAARCMTESEITEQFRQHIEELRPLKEKEGEIILKQIQLCFDLTLQILAEAFPQAKLQEIRPIAEIKPLDLGKSARQAVESCNQTNKIPKLIVIDMNRLIVTLADPK